jgi:hypothetical protein
VELATSLLQAVQKLRIALRHDAEFPGPLWFPYMSEGYRGMLVEAETLGEATAAIALLEQSERHLHFSTGGQEPVVSLRLAAPAWSSAQTVEAALEELRGAHGALDEAVNRGELVDRAAIELLDQLGEELENDALVPAASALDQLAALLDAQREEEFALQWRAQLRGEDEAVEVPTLAQLAASGELRPYLAALAGLVAEYGGETPETMEVEHLGAWELIDTLAAPLSDVALLSADEGTSSSPRAPGSAVRTALLRLAGAMRPGRLGDAARALSLRVDRGDGGGGGVRRDAPQRSQALPWEQGRVHTRGPSIA